MVTWLPTAAPAHTLPRAHFVPDGTLISLSWEVSRTGH